MSLKYQRDLQNGEKGFFLPEEAVQVFSDLIGTIANTSADPKSVFETMKIAFGDSVPSLNAIWAEIDLSNAMHKRATNAPRFIDQFWCGLQNLADSPCVPDVNTFNKILEEAQVPIRVNPPRIE